MCKNYGLKGSYSSKWTDTEQTWVYHHMSPKWPRAHDTCLFTIKWQSPAVCLEFSEVLLLWLFLLSGIPTPLKSFRVVFWSQVGIKHCIDILWPPSLDLSSCLSGRAVFSQLRIHTSQFLLFLLNSVRGKFWGFPASICKMKWLPVYFKDFYSVIRIFFCLDQNHPSEARGRILRTEQMLFVVVVNQNLRLRWE